MVIIYISNCTYILLEFACVIDYYIHLLHIFATFLLYSWILIVFLPEKYQNHSLK